MPLKSLFIPVLLLAALARAQEYKIGPDSQRQPNVPAGQVTRHSWTSRIFPGTTRDYWIYVPAQYKADKPACVMIFQDGAGMVSETGGFRVPIVFDNLIHKGGMPVTIGIFVNPGVLAALSPDQQPRYNRSFEYDALGDRYARFLIEEILPEVRKTYNLSKNPDDYAIGGSSSGAIAAYVAAWEHPEAFRRVLSFIGSFTNLRGGNILTSLARKTEPKPLRVFLQDGENDLNIYSGSWYRANQDLAMALEYAGYETKFVVGTEGHNGKHGSAILPDALRWLWHGYPQPVLASKGGGKERQFVTEILDPASGWELVSQGHGFTEGPAVDPQGNVYFTDIPRNRIYRAGIDGKVSIFREDTGGSNGLMFGPDGRLYAAQNGRRRIVAYAMDGKESVIAEGVASNDLAVAKNGGVYFSDPPDRSVWYIDPKGRSRVAYKGDIKFPNGVRINPDGSLLLVADMLSKWIWSFQIQADGSLENGQPFYRLETPDDDSASGADGMTLDSEGYLYVATKLGIQICDQPGRVVAIVPKPDNAWLSNAVLGGPGFEYLYITHGEKVYRRHLRRKGIGPGEAIKLPRPGL